MHSPDQRHRQKHSRKVRNDINGSGSRCRDERIQAGTRSHRVPSLVDRCALKDGHDDLGGAVREDDKGDDEAGDHESSVGFKDAAVEKEGGEFDECCCYGVEYFDYNKTLDFVVRGVLRYRRSRKVRKGSVTLMNNTGFLRKITCFPAPRCTSVASRKVVSKS